MQKIKMASDGHSEERRIFMNIKDSSRCLAHLKYSEFRTGSNASFPPTLLHGPLQDTSWIVYEECMKTDDLF